MKILTVHLVFALLAVLAAARASDTMQKDDRAWIFTSADSLAIEDDSVRYGYESVQGVKLFFREAGNPENPTIVMLHGFPSSSHQYRQLLDRLGSDFHVIAPDYPGFGASDFPSPSEYRYTFDQFSATIAQFLEQRGIDEYALLMHDYGGPVGFRIAQRSPDKVTALLIQNANIYESGINPKTWEPIASLWAQGRGNAELESAIIDAVFSRNGLQWQYTHGTRAPTDILPDNWLLDYERISRPGQHDVQLDLFYDYRTNLKRYPEWQAYLREHQPAVLVTWGARDAFFPVDGAWAYRDDVKDAEIHILDTGHFVLEEDSAVVARLIRDFMNRL
ncbi:MAG: alpha/beta hydrolase [Pseudomonadota bacterium]